MADMTNESGLREKIEEILNGLGASSWAGDAEVHGIPEAVDELLALISPAGEMGEPVCWIDQKTFDYLKSAPNDQATRVSVMVHGLGLVKKSDVGVLLSAAPRGMEG